ncbi:hypothetical protein DBV15_03447 [Temnothorax longispinosus]|uniref:Uncharacterized protein n=1 Tax=Temnothorax longispinosus TaxID=300112 RepID=A0A4S2KE11_9HYME|nr:hypothetical protein DBV15_03447 [Temnothorax longispinosus]
MLWRLVILLLLVVARPAASYFNLFLSYAEVRRLLGINPVRGDLRTGKLAVTHISYRNSLLKRSFSTLWLFSTQHAQLSDRAVNGVFIDSDLIRTSGVAANTAIAMRRSSRVESHSSRFTRGVRKARCLKLAYSVEPMPKQLESEIHTLVNICGSATDNVISHSTGVFNHGFVEHDGPRLSQNSFLFLSSVPHDRPRSKKSISIVHVPNGYLRIIGNEEEEQPRRY